MTYLFIISITETNYMVVIGMSCPVCHKSISRLGLHLNNIHKMVTESDAYQCLMAYCSLTVTPVTLSQ